MLKLRLGLTFPELYTVAGLRRIDAAFLEHLAHADASLRARLDAARAAPDALGRLAESDLLIAIAPHLEDWLAALFGVEAEVGALQAAQHELAPIYACKRQVVQRKAMNRYKAGQAAAFDGPALGRELEVKIGASPVGLRGELAYARALGEWGQDDAAHEADIDLVLRYAAWAVQTPEGKALHKSGVLFKTPRKLDYLRLIAVETERRDGI